MNPRDEQRLMWDGTDVQTGTETTQMSGKITSKQITTQSLINHVQSETHRNLCALSLMLWCLHWEDFSMCLRGDDTMDQCFQSSLCPLEATCLKAAAAACIRKHFSDVYLLGKKPKINLFDWNQNRKADKSLWHSSVITKPLWNRLVSQGLKDKHFYNFRKANSVTIVLQLMTSRKSFATKREAKCRDSHCWAAAIQTCDERLRQRNVASSTLAWFWHFALGVKGRQCWYLYK